MRFWSKEFYPFLLPQTALLPQMLPQKNPRQVSLPGADFYQPDNTEQERLRTAEWPSDYTCATDIHQTLLNCFPMGKTDGWEWLVSSDDLIAPNSLHELFDNDGRILAWVHKRPHYCDRGHWQLNVECVPDLDSQDRFPRYFMSLTRAKAEAEDFLKWRLFKIPYGGK